MHARILTRQVWCSILQLPCFHASFHPPVALSLSFHSSNTLVISKECRAHVLLVNPKIGHHLFALWASISKGIRCHSHWRSRSPTTCLSFSLLWCLTCQLVLALVTIRMQCAYLFRLPLGSVRATNFDAFWQTFPLLVLLFPLSCASGHQPVWFFLDGSSKACKQADRRTVAVKGLTWPHIPFFPADFPSVRSVLVSPHQMFLKYAPLFPLTPPNQIPCFFPTLCLP